jgi:thioredoxin family protein
VKDVPMHVLITPDGKVISLTLQGEELQKRVKQILDGDLYYESETPKK